ncbi:gamma-glutamyl-gamma-aminobutyrate hydrolase family protein [Algivirga pacifica]|uniref:Glutamine amidotransferase n=1 Tax=Algivirga pacifica TaxID=1162670 RepID=A0ABP9D988_9BACT
MVKIGITACMIYPDPSRKVFGPKTLCYIENDMANYVTQEGVLPILIPDLPDERLFPLLEELDGFILQGGSDVAAESYGEEAIDPTQWPGDAYRDQYELKILDFAIQNNKPVLGICRGMQLINTYFGGTLYQDLNRQKATEKVHRDAKQYDQLGHEITIEEGSSLQHIYPDTPKGYVNSVHHQGIKTLGKDLKAIAHSTEDNIIEAIEWEGGSPGQVLGVQWHPEFMKEEHENALSPLFLYRAFSLKCWQKKLV